MAPNEKNSTRIIYDDDKTLPFCKSEEEIVISGISGYFPGSDNVQELKQHLLTKKDVLTLDDRRWIPGKKF